MTIKEQEDKLFSEWKIDHKGFVPDGVADENAYLQSGKKILFLMKEVNDPDCGGGWDLRDHMRKGGKGSTWNNIARWTRGIRNLPGRISWDDDMEKMPKGKRIDTVRDIAAMNLKKTPGGATTVKADLLEVANNDKDFIRRQFDIYDADIVICCGQDVATLVHLCGTNENMASWKKTKNMVGYCEYKPGKYLISYWHPAARKSALMMLNRLIVAMEEINVLR